MANYGMPIKESPGWEIYTRWCRYSIEAKVIPDAFTYFEKVLVNLDAYAITRGGFRYWLGRLQIPVEPGLEPFVWRDPITKAWRLRDVDVTEK